MRLTSRDNLEVASIIGTSPAHLFFRCFLFDGAEADLDQTIILEIREGEAPISHLIDAECSGMLLRQGQLVCLESFGNLYVLEPGGWQLKNFERKPFRYLVAAYALADRLFAIGQGGAALRLEDSGWVDLLGGNIDCDFYAMAEGGAGALYLAGSGGQLFRIIGTNAERLPLPTNADLHAVTITDDGRIWTCGARGTCFVGDGEQWQDLSVPELGADFHEIKGWNGHIVVAAEKQVLRLGEAGLESWVDVPAFSLWQTGSRLWAKGMQQIHYIDAQDWRTYVLDVDVE